MDDKTPTKRKYELKRRAAEMAETRRRITQAALELHGTLGPARTTVSAIAERAGVQRHTVYRHFPSDTELFAACSAHFFAANPWPDPELWRPIGDPQKRLARALDDLYAWYERTEPMLSNVMRDLELVAAVRPTIVPFRNYLADAAEILGVGWRTRGHRRHVLDAALRHATDFRTWQSLVASDAITRTEAVQLATALVEAAAASPRRAAA